MSHTEIDELREEITRLRARLEAIEAPEAGRHPEHRRSTSRRAFFAGAAATGGAVLLTGRNAAAANGQALAQGQVSEATETTELKFPGNLGSARPRSHVFVAQDGAWSTPASPTATFAPEDGSRASIAAFSGNHAMHGVFAQTNAPVLGSSGGRFVGEDARSYGLMVQGRRATMRLRPPNGTQTPPPSRFDFHNDGEVTVDSNRDLWVCVASGSPGTWRKLSGPAAAGAYHPIVPARAFDSRRSMPGSGIFRPNTNRVVSVKDGRDPLSGAITVSNAVPEGATAVTFNLTVTQTGAAGFLFLAPGNQTTVTGSTINWSASATTIANGGTVKLDNNRQVRIFCVANGAHVILDITGYYR